jgi:hypothetical protein
MSLPAAASHSRAVLSRDAVMTRVPSGEKAALKTALSWPRRTAMSLPAAASHSRAVLSHEAVTTRVPSVEKAALHEATGRETWLVFGGAIATQESWEQVSAAWNDVLADFSIPPPLHMVDFAHSKPPFDKLDKAAKEALLNRLLDIQAAHIKHIIGSLLQNSLRARNFPWFWIAGAAAAQADAGLKLATRRI